MAALSSTSMKDWLMTKQTQDRAVGKCENLVGQVAYNQYFEEEEVFFQFMTKWGGGDCTPVPTALKQSPWNSSRNFCVFCTEE